MSSSRMYYTGTVLTLDVGCSLRQAALCRSKERCSSMDRFANLSAASVLPMQRLFIPGWRFQEFPPWTFSWAFEWPSDMSKSCGCLFLDLAKAQQRLAMVCLSINISVRRRGPKPTASINFGGEALWNAIGHGGKSGGALNAFQFDQKAQFQPKAAGWSKQKFMYLYGHIQSINGSLSPCLHIIAHWAAEEGHCNPGLQMRAVQRVPVPEKPLPQNFPPVLPAYERNPGCRFLHPYLIHCFLTCQAQAYM